MSRTISLLIALLACSVLPALAENPTLRGSRASMVRQNHVAREEDFSFLRTPAQVREFLAAGYLVPLSGNADYALGTGVSFPEARPEVRTFVERLGVQHHAACGERLVVTSLTRPLSEQPANAHALSVHPAGMAADLRVSRNAVCREWLENTLLALEAKGVLDVTREARPPHYHVALFPDAYHAYVAGMLADSVRETRPAAPVPEAAAAAAPVLPVARRAALVSRLQPVEEGSGGWVSLVALALAPFGLALGLRRGSGTE